MRLLYLAHVCLVNKVPNAHFIKHCGQVIFNIINDRMGSYLSELITMSQKIHLLLKIYNVIDTSINHLINQ